MAIPTSRTKEAGSIHINDSLCNGCGTCVAICSDQSLVLKNEKAFPSENPFFGCVGCGHCMAICPTGAITISGRTLNSNDFFDLPDKHNNPDYKQLMTLFERRRSIRNFKDKAVEPEIAQKILAAAQTAPMGLPPSDVHVMVLDSRSKTRAFAKDYCEFLEGYKWFVSNWFLALMRPFWGKSNDEMFRGFIKPLFKVYSEGFKNNRNLVNYDAPLAMYFYGSPFTDPADPLIAATYAMLSAESLGLGTCMLGAVHPMIQYGRKGRIFREQHGIKYPSREGLFVVFGFPVYTFKKGIRRTFAEITYN